MDYSQQVLIIMIINSSNYFGSNNYFYNIPDFVLDNQQDLSTYSKKEYKIREKKSNLFKETKIEFFSLKKFICLTKKHLYRCFFVCVEVKDFVKVTFWFYKNLFLVSDSLAVKLYSFRVYQILLVFTEIFFCIKDSFSILALVKRVKLSFYTI